MIVVQDLVRTYGDFLAVDRLNFTIEKGKILGFLGPNGSGKTTTMRMLSGFMPPTSGRILIDGMDIQENDLEAKKIIGYLPETPPLYLDMRVDEYLTYVAHLKGVPSSLIPERLRMVKAKCGLVEVRHMLLRSLSKGFRQRVGIAQSVINAPAFLILDEPTVGLDPKQISEIRQLIKSLAGEMTVILSTHILPEVTLICDDILIVHRGRMMFRESLKNIPGEDLERLFLKYTYEADEARVSPC
jgi:ABC-2 type transport system ATP-binding protein